MKKNNILLIISLGLQLASPYPAYHSIFNFMFKNKNLVGHEGTFLLIAMFVAIMSTVLCLFKISLSNVVDE